MKKLGISVLLAGALLLAACGEGTSSSEDRKSNQASSLLSSSVEEGETLDALAHALEAMEYDTLALTLGIDGTLDLDMTTVTSSLSGVAGSGEMSVTDVYTNYVVGIAADGFRATSRLADLTLDEQGTASLKDTYMEAAMEGGLGFDLRVDTTVFRDGTEVEEAGSSTSIAIPETTFDEEIHIKDGSIYLDFSEEGLAALQELNIATLEEKMLLPCPERVLDLSFLSDLKEQGPAVIAEIAAGTDLGAACTLDGEGRYNIHMSFSGAKLREMAVQYYMFVLGVAASDPTTSQDSAMTSMMEESIRELLKNLEFGGLDLDLAFSADGDYFALDVHNLAISGSIDPQTGTDPILIDADLDLSFAFEPGAEVDTGWTPEGTYVQPEM